MFYRSTIAKLKPKGIRGRIRGFERKLEQKERAERGGGEKPTRPASCPPSIVLYDWHQARVLSLTNIQAPAVRRERKSEEIAGAKRLKLYVYHIVFGWAGQRSVCRLVVLKPSHPLWPVFGHCATGFGPGIMCVELFVPF